MIFKKLVGATILLASFSAMGNETTASVNLEYIQNWGGGDVSFVKTSEANLVNPAGCSYTGDYYLAASSSDTTKSMLIAAHMANRKVQLTIYSGSCTQNRPVIVAVKLTD